MPELDVFNVKPSLISAVTIFLIVLVTVPIAKWALNRVPVPGLTDLVNSI